MKENIWPAVKRLIRVVIAGAIAGAITSFMKEASTWPFFFLIQAAITAAINALAKYIRAKWGIELPI